jgi:aspartate/methionine/tyrosine aminotransferase
MKWISEAVKNAPPALIGEILKIASEYKNVISLSLGEPDFDTPPHVVEAGITALREGFTHYTSNLGILELREAICEKLEKDNNVYINTDEVMAAAGAGTAIDLLMRAVLNPGDEVLVQDPGYFNYIFIAAYIGAKIVPVHVTEENDFALNPQDLEEKITDKTKLLILNSPANPTGSVIPEKHLRKIADIVI